MEGVQFGECFSPQDFYCIEVLLPILRNGRRCRSREMLRDKRINLPRDSERCGRRFIDITCESEEGKWLWCIGERGYITEPELPRELCLE